MTDANGVDPRFRLYEASEAGPDGYPLAWHKHEDGAIKDLVRELAAHRCVRCWHPYRCGAHGNGEWSPCDEGCKHDGPTRRLDSGRVEAQWRILTVHHLDGDKLNCRWWNLAALCQRCHLTIQGKVTMEQVWPWEHSPWFKPFAAAYYAHIYLDEDLDENEVWERMDELLALEWIAPPVGCDA